MWIYNQRASQRAKCKFTCDLSASAASEDNVVVNANLDKILYMFSTRFASAVVAVPQLIATPLLIILLYQIFCVHSQGD